MAIEEPKKDVNNPDNGNPNPNGNGEPKKDEPKAKDDSEKTYEELKAEAEEAEAKAKEAKNQETDEQKRQNMIIRRDKALGKVNPEPKNDSPKDELDTRDLITLGKHDISENSEKAKILDKYKKGGLIKSFADGLEHPGIKAEFAVIDAKNNAKSVIDENDTDEVKVKTTKEIINGYRNSGVVPKDKKAQKAIAEDNLRNMGILK